jgi:hypothetical protein
VATGTATLNLGARPTASTPGDTYATVDVTGLSGLTAATHMEAFMQADSTADHSAEEHLAEQFDFKCQYLSAASLRIHAWVRRGRAWGQFTIHYATV